jgi:hypothetical protein
MAINNTHYLVKHKSKWHIGVRVIKQDGELSVSLNGIRVDGLISGKDAFPIDEDIYYDWGLSGPFSVAQAARYLVYSDYDIKDVPRSLLDDFKHQQVVSAFTELNSSVEADLLSSMITYSESTNSVSFDIGQNDVTFTLIYGQDLPYKITSISGAHISQFHIVLDATPPSGWAHFSSCLPHTSTVSLAIICRSVSCQTLKNWRVRELEYVSLITPGLKYVDWHPQAAAKIGTLSLRIRELASFRGLEHVNIDYLAITECEDALSTDGLPSNITRLDFSEAVQRGSAGAVNWLPLFSMAKPPREISGPDYARTLNTALEDLRSTPRAKRKLFVANLMRQWRTLLPKGSMMLRT